VYDVRSGVLSTSLTFSLTDPAGWNSGRQLFPTRPGDGQAQTNSYLGGGLVAVTNFNVDITNRTLGVWTARLYAADFDVDRPGDYAGVTQAFAVTVMDDDRIGPRMTNLQISGASAVIFATGFEDLDGWATQSAATWTNLSLEGAWVSTGAYALAFNPRGDVGRHLGFNDAGDAVELPPFTNAGWIVAWTRLRRERNQYVCARAIRRADLDERRHPHADQCGLRRRFVGAGPAGDQCQLSAAPAGPGDRWSLGLRR
jgi:hypothetical protein